MPLPRGAPPKAAVAPPPPDLPAWQKVVSQQSKRRQRYNSWKHGGDNKLVLDAAVDAILTNDDHIMVSPEIVSRIDIPCATLEQTMAQERARRATLDKEKVHGNGLFNQTTDDLINEKKALTTSEFCKDLQDIICIHDDLNNGMSRKEVCHMISDFCMVPHKTAENCLIT
jgi:hypothetical protein